MGQSSKHINSFDGLRGYAIIFVMLFHVGFGILPGGYVGVDLFFVVSGYLITSLIHDEYLSTGTISFSKFYARRAIRLFPPLIVCLILANMLWSHSALLHESNRTMATLSGALYFTNLLYDYVCGNLAHLWSLSVEEHFYLVWPLTALFFIFRVTDKNKYSFFVLLIVALSAFRVLAFLYQDKWTYGIFRINPYEFTLCRIDGIVMGALLYFMVHNKVISHDFLGARRYATAYLTLIFLFFLAFGMRVGLYSPYWMEGGFIVTNLAGVFTVFVAVVNSDHRFLSNKIILWVGKRSYGIYAYHFPVFLATEEYGVPGNPVNLIFLNLARFALSILLAVLSYNYIERPILRLKANFKPKITVPAEVG